MDTIFIFLKSNYASKLLGRIPGMLENTSLEDIVLSYSLLDNDELAVYYFTWFLADDCNVDPFKLIELYPELNKIHGLALRTLPMSSLELDTRNVPEKLVPFRAKLKSENAPMLNRT